MPRAASWIVSITTPAFHGRRVERRLVIRFSSSTPISDWRQLGFVEDASWLTSNGPVGVDPTFHMGTSLTDMPGASGYASVFLRRIFNVANPAQIGTLRVEAAYDDGFS